MQYVDCSPNSLQDSSIARLSNVVRELIVNRTNLVSHMESLTVKTWFSLRNMASVKYCT